KRGREYESPITLEYLMKLCSFYDEYLKDYRLSPVLILDVEGFDYVNNERDRMHIILEVRRFTGYYG
ncbi:MAG TPA: deoxynucleoside kinase, partial [bacterium]|nr:deoxynucleoside kinase [bacterium]